MITFRKGALEDLDTILTLRMAMLAEVGNIEDNSNLSVLKAANRNYLMKKLASEQFIAWLAEAQGEAVSICAVIPFERPPISENLKGIEGNILNMYTLPEWRGKGIASSLLSRIISFMETKGAARLWLRATPSGRSIYEKAGFQVYGKSTISDSIWMELFL